MNPQKKTFAPTFLLPKLKSASMDSSPSIHSHTNQSRRIDKCCVSAEIQVFKLVVLDLSINN